MFFPSIFCKHLWLFFLTFHGGEKAEIVLPADLDEARIVVGSPVLVMFEKKERSGQMILSTEKRDGHLIVQDHTSVPELNIEEKLTVTMDAHTRAPLAVQCEAVFGESSLEIDLKWDGNTVTGSLKRGLEETKVNQEHAAGLFTRVGLFVLLPAFEWKEHTTYKVNMFDATQAKIYAITLVVTGKEKVDVLAGSFEAWRIELNGHEARQIVYITDETPARMVKIEVLDSPWHYELAK